MSIEDTNYKQNGIFVRQAWFRKLQAKRICGDLRLLIWRGDSIYNYHSLGDINTATNDHLNACPDTISVPIMVEPAVKQKNETNLGQRSRSRSTTTVMEGNPPAHPLAYT